MNEDERPPSPAEAGSPEPVKRERRPRVDPRPKDEGAERGAADDGQLDEDGGNQAGAVNRSRPIYDTPPNGRSRGNYGPSGPRGNYGAPGARGRPPRANSSRGDAPPRYGSDRAPYARPPEGPRREGGRDDRAPRSRDGARPTRGSGYDRPSDSRPPRRDGGGGERTRPYRGRPSDGPRPYGDRTGDAPRPYSGGAEQTRAYGERTGDSPRPYRGRDPRDSGSRGPRPRDTRPVTGDSRPAGPRDTDRRGPPPQSGGYGQRPRSQSGGDYGQRPRSQSGDGYGPRPRSGGPRPQPGASRSDAGGYGPRPTRPRFDRNTPDRGREGDDERAALPQDPREAALRILHAVDTRSAFSDRLLDSAHAVGGDPRDRALLHELVKGALRWRGRIDWALEARVHQGLAKTPPWIRNVLRLGAYQLLFLDRVPAHAVVDESVKLAHEYGHPGTAGLVNSVLRRLDTEKSAIAWPDGDDVESLAVWGSHPEWIVERWLDRFGPEATRALLLADNEPARLGLRVNPLRTTREGLIERLARDGVTAKPAQRSPDMVWVEGHHGPLQLAAFREGWCTVQDESEAFVSRLVAPREHERVLDLCAAPGGKCTHIAELMGDEGEVWAMERQASRLQSLEQNLSRLGIHSVHVVEGDGRTYTFPMPFDRVLVDAPCSGLGVLGRRADARWRKGPEILREMPPLQLELLLAASQRARPGGVVVYSVCSFEPEETDAVVERFLRQDPSVVLESAEGALPEDTVDEQGLMRVLPHVHGCDGAFAARFRKT